MDGDPYADLSRLCGVAAFKLPRRPDFLPLPPPPDPILLPPAVPYGYIPLPLLISDYLCYDTPVSHSSSSSIPSSPPLLRHSPSPPCPNESLGDCSLSGPSHVEREILPPCVLNLEDSITWTPERDPCVYPAPVGVGDSDYKIWTPDSTPPEIDEMGGLSERDTTDDLISITKKSAFPGEYSERSLYCIIKELTFWSEDVILGKKSCEGACHGGEDHCLPSPKKRKTAKSEGGRSHSYFTRSKYQKATPF